MMAAARDIAIIVVAVESIVIGALLIYLIFQMRSLIRLLKKEVQPILDSTRETVGTVRGTTAFLSDTLVGPVVQVAGYFAGLRRMVQALRGRGDGRTANPTPQSEGAQPTKDSVHQV